MTKKMRKIFNVAVHILEYVVAVLTLCVLIYLIGSEVYKMFSLEGYIGSGDAFLQNILAVVVGLEFVRMLINLTPSNILEVLIVALARQVLIDNNSVWGNLVCVLCISGLFAVRRFLVKKEDLAREMGAECDDEAKVTKTKEENLQ
ncbi:MAG: hypothetical protein E7643_08895 [Ruminococcaceae bacterium]|nr:hypothetical protein [Oscillospiraceae bacterium]